MRVLILGWGGMIDAKGAGRAIAVPKRVDLQRPAAPDGTVPCAAATTVHVEWGG